MTLIDLAKQLNRIKGSKETFPYLKFGFIFHKELSLFSPKDIIATAQSIDPSLDIKDSFTTEINKGKVLGDFASTPAYVRIIKSAGITGGVCSKFGECPWGAK